MRALIVILLAILFQSNAIAEINIGNLVQVTRSALVLNRNTNTFNTVITVKNTSAQPIAGPIALGVSNISISNVTLREVAGFIRLGMPYVDGPLNTAALDPGQSAQFVLQFNNPSRRVFTYRLNIFNQLSQAQRGVLIPGPQNALAIEATYHLVDQWGVSETEISLEGNTEIARTLIEIWFKEDALSSDVNSVIQSIGGKIISMSENLPIVMVRVPDSGSIDTIENTLDQLNAHPDVIHSSLAFIPSIETLPENFSPNNSNSYAAIDHLLAIKAHALWNANMALQQRQRPLIIITDTFGDGNPTSSNYSIDLDEPSGFFDNNNSFYHTFAGRNHGYIVLSVIAGNKASTNDKAYGVFLGSELKPLVNSVDIFNERIREGISEVSRRDWGATEQLTLDRIQNAIFSGKRVVLNTSIAFGFCDDIDNADNVRLCNEEEILWHGRMWQRKLISYNLINKFIHVTGAGNIGPNPVPIMGHQAKFASPFASAALNEEIGLENTFVVENWENIGGDSMPFKPSVRHNFSFSGGNIAGIGTNINVVDNLGNISNASGSSFSTPQVTGLASFIWSVNPSLKPPEVVNILKATVQPGTNVIDAYAAVLAVDDFNINTAGTGRVRKAILDVDGRGGFDANDLERFINEFAARNGAIDYSRYDLNGNGRTGETKCDIGENCRVDLNNDVNWNNVTKTIEGISKKFDENKLRDIDVLCYYGYSDLYVASSVSSTGKNRENIISDMCTKATINISINLQNIPNFTPDIYIGVYSSNNILRCSVNYRGDIINNSICSYSFRLGDSFTLQKGMLLSNSCTNAEGKTQLCFYNPPIFTNWTGDCSLEEQEAGYSYKITIDKDASCNANYTWP